ncbi:DUF2235 domain-containing protein [Nocardia brasiliensis]|uniref:DUF2235 domain-containing protein n=1 Tax=Nocardia brasiliensis TaxID=37326 RepID=UPI0018960AB2|nr:DUF2235 domain-containing protein [Nocardia brasiliensis]MBF6127304.1 DUF2235 domain-containing protein [Nocardia brasiliensis]MBF6547385.1 DUF2235 domain-containing protein [Nocardia brasiliensis]
MKRLVVCCDGTWKAESSSTVSNIIKIAQTIRFDAPGPTGEKIQQWVTYVSGPGARGFLADRLMGGAFGLGLEANLSSAYWHLALNWEPGDEIYIFGFSRGAFTARSLSGLIDRIGILTPEAMISGKYPKALEIHQQVPPKDGSIPAAWTKFRKDNCHVEQPKVNFLGVFDTVGALGVPGLTSLRYRFHNVKLAPSVHCARQALAIDERRRNFEPCLWEVPVEPNIKYRRGFQRVKQVWFEGAHSDVGGGHKECGLSDVTLRWMVREAESVGLAFDHDRLAALSKGCLASGADHMKLHPSLGVGYRVLNVLRTLRHPRSPRFYLDSWRRLANGHEQGIRLASLVNEADDYLPPNLRRWRARFGGMFPEELLEKVTPVSVHLLDETAEPDPVLAPA